MCSSAIFILDIHGKVCHNDSNRVSLFHKRSINYVTPFCCPKALISRNYRGDVEMSIIDKFLPLLREREEEGNVTPLLQTSGCTFMYIQHKNLYIVSVSRNNANAAMTFTFLHKLVEVMTEYFEEIEEESIRDNFVIIFELLDEMSDFGYPQTTESKILQEYAASSLFFQSFF